MKLRTPFDNIVYTVMHDVSAIDAELLDLAVMGVKRYSRALQCPMGAFFNPGDDPARVSDVTYHKLFETCLAGFIRRHVLAVHQFCVTAHTQEARREQVDFYLEG
jgi:hypothetical protein